MRSFTRLAAVLCTAMILVNCGSHTMSVNPSANRLRSLSNNQSQPSNVFANGVPDVFAAAQSKDLTDADLDTFIDKSVTGPDRILARKFMRMMPPGMRGDFVYIDSHDHLITNNPRLLPGIRITHPNAQSFGRNLTPSGRTLHKLSGYEYVSPCSPPNAPDIKTHGPYERQVSKCGFTAGITFLHLYCGHTQLASTSGGYMYMELQGNGVGLPAKSLSEGGLFVPAPGNDHSINPYVSVPGNNQQMVNGTARYDCNYDLGFESGATQDGRYIFTASGQLPSSCTPQAAFCSGNQFRYDKQAWLFANAPSDITGLSSDAAGVTTPCINCSISRVTGVAQGNNIDFYTANGDRFGADPNGGVWIHYMQTAFGEWESNCTPGTNLCTFDYSLIPTKYYGGYQYYPGTFNAASLINPSLAATYGPWESWDGINVTPGRTSDLTASGAFTLTLPTYSWRQGSYKNPGVERVSNWEINTGGTTWDTYCTYSHTSDTLPLQELGGEDCDGNENTDHPSMPYPGGVAI